MDFVFKELTIFTKNMFSATLKIKLKNVFCKEPDGN